jgi:hypothetical protein
MRRAGKTMVRRTARTTCNDVRPKLGRQRMQLPTATLRKFILGAPIRTRTEGLLS